MTDTLRMVGDVPAIFLEVEQAARNRRAVHFALSWPAVDAKQWPCLFCSFVACGATDVSLVAAMDAHARYINAHADRDTDPHFEDMRRDALLGI